MTDPEGCQSPITQVMQVMFGPASPGLMNLNTDAMRTHRQKLNQDIQGISMDFTQDSQNALFSNQETNILSKDKPILSMTTPMNNYVKQDSYEPVDQFDSNQPTRAGTPTTDIENHITSSYYLNNRINKNITPKSPSALSIKSVTSLHASSWPPMTITFKEVSYQILLKQSLRSSLYCFKDKKNKNASTLKTILHKLEGNVKSGELIAVMGEI